MVGIESRSVRGGTWLQRHPRGDTAPRARLFCFPFAGGGAAVFHEWPAGIRGDVEVVAIRPPGRESRLREAPFVELEALAAALEPVLAPWLDVPFAFFGHSMGALVAFEMARRLSAGGTGPRHLFVSARRAPQVPSALPPFWHLEDGPFLEEIQTRFGELPVEITSQQPLLDLLLPCLRADVTLAETPAHRPGVMLDCPMTGFCGADDPTANVRHMEPWREHTRAGFHLMALPGGHFFLDESADAMHREINARFCDQLTVVSR